jgi:protein-S-isoprenylcysteine O-methyltransferase Ste14
MKLVRVSKFTLKVLFVYIVFIILVSFADPRPLSFYFISGCVLIFLGEATRLWAAGHLNKNEVLTTTGPYAYVKNPLYIGTFFITTGFCIIAKGGSTGNFIFDNVNWFILALAILVFVFYYVPYKKRVESKRLHQIFGKKWEDYDKNVPDYFPRFTPYTGQSNSCGWSIKTLIQNSEHWTLLAVICGVLIIAFNRYIFVLFRL